MADETKPQAGTTETIPTQAVGTTTANTQAVSANTQPEPVKAVKVEDLPDDIQKLIKELRAENAKNRKAANDAETKAAADAEAKSKEQGEFKKLFEARDKELSDLKAELTKRERQDLQRKVAERVGIPAKLALRLNGDTEAEMETDAQEVLAALPKGVATNDAKRGTGNGATAPRSYGGLNKEQVAQWGAIDPKHIPS
jgi:hypothetical protein